MLSSCSHKVAYTNAPLSDEDCRQIRQLLASAEERMELLSSEIVELETQVFRYKITLVQLGRGKNKYRRLMSRLSKSIIRRLESSKLRCSRPPDKEESIRQSLVVVEKCLQMQNKQLAQLTEQVAQYRIALAPHKKLPEDVLRYIFTLSCAGAPDAALALSHVCSAWRRLALDIPLLCRQRVVLFDERAVLRRHAKFVRRQARLSRLRRRVQIFPKLLRWITNFLFDIVYALLELLRFILMVFFHVFCQCLSCFH